jgi:hypothetical protein
MQCWAAHASAQQGATNYLWILPQIEYRDDHVRFVD